MGYQVFISHSGEDTWVAKKIAAECEAVNADTFLDEAQIAVGAKFEEDVVAALRLADELVVLMTPWALERPYVWMEIGAAWFKDIPIVVLLLGVTVSHLQQRPNMPRTLRSSNVLPLNQIDRYLGELAERITLAEDIS